MCIIVYKPAGRAMPDADTLQNCFWSNPDGAGFMYPLEGKGLVKTRKGFMTLMDLENALAQIPNVKNIPVVIHFRIGTQGFNDKRNTHPFPISNNDDTLTSSSSVSKVSLTHNGIIPMTTNCGTYTHTKTKEQFSDTFYFVRDYANLIIDNEKYWENKKNIVLLKRLAESKLCIMGCDGHVEMIGHFIHEKKDGCYYSNTSYEQDWVHGAYTYRSHNAYGSSVIGSNGTLFDRAVDWADDDDIDECYRQMADRYSAEGASRGTQSTSIVGTHKTLERIDGGVPKILASFVPAKLLVHDENTGRMIDSQTELFVHDYNGQVYLFDNKANGMVKMEGYFSVTDDLDIKGCDKDMGVLFTILG